MNPETIAAITALVVAIGAIVVGFNNSRAAAAAAKDARDEAAAGRAEAKLGREAAEAAQAAAEGASRKIVATADGIYEVGVRLDGRLSALVIATQKLALAEGRAEGIAAEQERVASGAASIPSPPPTPPPPRQRPMEPINGIPAVLEPEQPPDVES